MLQGRSGPDSDSKRDKAGANHNQADNDNGKKTGRSKIFAHDDTHASISKISGKPARGAKSLQSVAFATMAHKSG
jgi:hypothetical protein